MWDEDPNPSYLSSPTQVLLVKSKKELYLMLAIIIGNEIIHKVLKSS